MQEPVGRSVAGAVGIAASAGGIEALIELLCALRPDFPLPILLAQHLSRTRRSIFPMVLAWRCGCRAKWAEQGEAPEPGIIYVAPPAHSIELAERRLHIAPLADTAGAWLALPDVFLHSIARQHGANSVGIVLSGMMAVGIEGLRAIQAVGGVTFAQSEASSKFLEMPQAAIDLGKADIILPPCRIAEALNAMVDPHQAWV